MALWWLLRAAVARVGLVGEQERAQCRQRAGCNAGTLTARVAVALWWLLRAAVARVGLVGVPFPCGAGRTFGGFWRVLERWRPGKREP